jgi:ABC-type transport system substrate-binding protein
MSVHHEVFTPLQMPIIGNDAFKNQPVGLGPYRFVSYQPGIELVLEAYTDYWRKTPAGTIQISGQHVK